MEQLGLIGLGRMGQALAGRLLTAGFPLTVWNRTRSRADALLAQGARWAESPADLAAQTTIILTILTDDQAVEQVYCSDQGLLAAAIPGRLLIEMSTVRTSTILTLAPLISAQGARLLDAPVSGTLEPARQGQLLTMVGGDPNDLQRARPVLEAISRRIVHLGPNGAGTTMKIALNMPMAIFWAGLAEAMAIGHQFGLRLDDMLDIYLDSPVAMPALRGKAPLLRGEPHEVAFDVTGVRKDLLAMVATGQDAGVPTATGAAALNLFAAATAAGYGEHDLVAIVAYVREMVQRSYGQGVHHAQQTTT